MADWPLKYDGPCACRFVRREEFGEAEQVEWCGLHASIRDAVLALKDTEIADMACTGSHAPVEDALGRLFALVPNAEVTSRPTQRAID